MGTTATPGVPAPTTRFSLQRATWHTLGLIVAAILAYAVWRGYQNPDLLLDLAALRLC